MLTKLKANSMFSFVGIQDYITENTSKNDIDDNEPGKSITVRGVTISKADKGFKVGSKLVKWDSFKSIDDIQHYIDGVLKQQGIAASLRASSSVDKSFKDFVKKYKPDGKVRAPRGSRISYGVEMLYRELKELAEFLDNYDPDKEYHISYHDEGISDLVGLWPKVSRVVDKIQRGRNW